MPSPASIFILTGAGISAESGVETFRDKGGIWSKVRLEDVATPEAFRRDPDKVQAFYNGRRAALQRLLQIPPTGRSHGSKPTMRAPSRSSPRISTTFTSAPAAVT